MPQSVDDNPGWRGEAEALAQSLLREQLDPEVIAAIGRVPRHLFLPVELRKHAYEDCALPIGREQTISQPFIVAVMTELLHVRRDDRVLEIGTGSGYQTAVLCEMGAEVFSVEIVAELSLHATEILRAIGYAPHLRVGDGAQGWPEHAPFDRVLVTAAARAVPRALLDQLDRNGRLVVPLEEADGDQWIWELKKSADGEIERKRHLAVRFVPMTGRAQ